jgi:hypothetical protein
MLDNLPPIQATYLFELDMHIFLREEFALSFGSGHKTKEAFAAGKNVTEDQKKILESNLCESPGGEGGRGGEGAPAGARSWDMC